MIRACWGYLEIYSCRVYEASSFLCIKHLRPRVGHAPWPQIPTEGLSQRPSILSAKHLHEASSLGLFEASSMTRDYKVSLVTSRCGVKRVRDQTSPGLTQTGMFPTFEQLVMVPSSRSRALAQRSPVSIFIKSQTNPVGLPMCPIHLSLLTCGIRAYLFHESHVIKSCPGRCLGRLSYAMPGDRGRIFLRQRAFRGTAQNPALFLLWCLYAPSRLDILHV